MCLAKTRACIPNILDTVSAWYSFVSPTTTMLKDVLEELAAQAKKIHDVRHYC